MTTKLGQALKDLEATCEDLADLDEAFRRGRLQGLEEAAKAMCYWCAEGSQADFYKNKGWKHALGSGNVPCEAGAIREKIKGSAVGAQEENTQ